MRYLGQNSTPIFPVALGCMGMSGMYGKSEEKESIETIQAAIDHGVNLLDTGDFYGSGHNELLIQKAIQGRRDQVLLSVKFGALRAPGGGWGGFDSRPSAIKNFITYSLTRLKVEVIDVYRPARLDPDVPIEDTVGAIKSLIQAGYVRYLGLSEVGPETIRRAHLVHPVSDLQIEYSLISRGPERTIFPVLKELGISATIYGVLSRGLLSGSQVRDKSDIRAFLPRFRGNNLVQNQKIVEQLKIIADEKNLTVSQLAIAWALHQGDNLIPVLGARTTAQLKEALHAVSVELSPNELNRILKAAPIEAVAGTRYDERQMKTLDSEL